MLWCVMCVNCLNLFYMAGPDYHLGHVFELNTHFFLFVILV